MRSFSIAINEKYFNFLWRAVHSRENELLAILSRVPEESDEAALTTNDLIYLRLCKKELEEKAKLAVFSDAVFSVEDGFIDISTL